MAKETSKQKENLRTRPPVVVVLGHVDHGKSSILEAIKDLKITEKESGGITQHIGAYEIEEKGKKITFIDTPGHEVFFAMRSRGAKVADIAVLVVAADDGVKTQTKEAITHIKKSGIPIIVAINKMDKSIADPEKVKRELSQANVLVESMGGKVPCAETSAQTGKNIPELLELILLVAEMENLKANSSKLGEGVVIETYLDPLRGPTATLLVTDGLFKKGDIVGTSSAFGKMKILENFQGKGIDEAKPSMPVITLGFENLPQIGEKFKVFPNIETAREFIKKPEQEAQVLVIEPGKDILNLILKADVSGSLEALKEVLKNLPQEKVILRILKGEVGEVNENDVKLARAGKAMVLSFRVKTDSIAQGLAQREKIRIKGFDVIYELIQYVREQMEKTVKPKIVRVDLGKMKTLVIFRTEKKRQIVGGKIIEGEVKKGVKIEVMREEEIIGKGRLAGLQKNKKDIEKGKKGDEVGILYQGDVKIEEGDILVFYTKESRKNV